MLNFVTNDTFAAFLSHADSPDGDDEALLAAVRKLDYFFLGFKNATDCIDSYRIQHNGVDIGSTMQNKASLESFLHSQVKPHTEKSNKRGSYSLWEDVVKADESVCGVYLTYEYLASQLSPTNNQIKVTFPVTIGFDMLLPLQGFNLFPNCIFGDLSLVIKTNPNALVWCCTDPTLYIPDLSQVSIGPDVSNDLLDAYSTAIRRIVPLGSSWYDRRFTQFRVPGLARSNVYIKASDVTANFKSAPLRIDPDTLITLDVQSTITGFSLKDSVRQAFAQYYASVPFVIPSERIFIQSFSTGPTQSGLNAAMTIPLNNAKEVAVLFPRNANDLTVFRNPQYRHMMVTMLNRNFPQKGADTNSTEFYRLELESCNLDTILPPTQSFENSYLKKVTSAKPLRQRCTEDDTDFLMLFNLERQSSNAFFSDPVNSASETITLTGSPQEQGLGDIYYDISSENSDAIINTSYPILCMVSDTFWFLSTGERASYEIALSWNECLAKNFPNVYQRLAASQ
jgi:hypothetical protein